MSEKTGVLGVSLHTTDEAAALRLPVHPTGSREGHGEAGIPGGGRCTITTEGQAGGIHPSASQQAPQGRAGVSVYRSPEMRSACKALREASAEEHRRGSHRLHFDDREFLHLHCAVSHARNKLRVAVSKGRAEIGDLRATDSLWEKLEAIMWKRQTWRRA